MRRPSTIAIAGLLAVCVGLGGLNTPAGASTASSHKTLPPPPAGYHLVLTDRFNEGSLDLHKWIAYEGQPGSDLGGWWDPSHVTVQNGMLILRAYHDPEHYKGPSKYPPWVEGGVSSAVGLEQKYGEYLVRSRVTSAVGVTEVALLWPAGRVWPPEIDFAESFGYPGRSFGTLHWGFSSDPQQEQRSVDVDLTQWQTWGVIWTPKFVEYTLNGKIWATMANESPNVPMVLDLQQQVWGCGVNRWEQCPSNKTPPEVDMEVAWVAAYAPGG
jgi:hypothetical protein